MNNKKIFYTLIYVFLIVPLLPISTQVNITSQRKLLADKLLTGYDKNVKPEGQVNISIQVFLMQIVNVFEKDQIISLNTWITQSWYDQRLTWDPIAYAGLDFTAISSDKFWA